LRKGSYFPGFLEAVLKLHNMLAGRSPV
jgi:hypothetical protein